VFETGMVFVFAILDVDVFVVCRLVDIVVVPDTVLELLIEIEVVREAVDVLDISGVELTDLLTGTVLDTMREKL